MTAVRDVIETVAKALADSPQRIAVTETEHRGTTVEEVNRLLKQFAQMRKMLKAMGGLATGKPDRKARARLSSLMGR